MTAGIAPPTHLFRLFLAIVATFAIAVLFPTARMFADTDSPVILDNVQTASTPKAASTAAGALHPAGAYMGMADAIATARKAGGTGDVLQIDLEYDAFRGFATCDVTFSSGTEYEMHAETGEVLGSKQKDPAKLGLLTALATDSKSLKSFTDIIGHVSSATGQAVLEMELKHPKAASGVLFEVVTADGLTTHFDAHTGKSTAAP